MPKLTDLTLNQLKEEAVKLGMPQDDVDKFNVKAQLVATINALKASQATKKVATLNPPADPKEEKLTERRWRSKAMKMRAKLDSQPKVMFFIPLSGEEKPGVVREVTVKGRKEFIHVRGAIETVTLNGCKTIIPKGVRVQVPEQVADVLAESYRLTQEAGKEFLVDRVDEKTGKSVKEALS